MHFHLTNAAALRKDAGCTPPRNAVLTGDLTPAQVGTRTEEGSKNTQSGLQNKTRSELKTEEKKDAKKHKALKTNTLMSTRRAAVLKRRAAHKLEAEASCYPPASSSGHRLASASVSENTPLPRLPLLQPKRLKLFLLLLRLRRSTWAGESAAGPIVCSLPNKESQLYTDR